MPDGTGHACPEPSCTASVPADMLACRPHWYAIPKPLRTAVWRAWDRGRGAGSPAHSAAIKAAVDHLRRAAP